MKESASNTKAAEEIALNQEVNQTKKENVIYLCDRCGFKMEERNCKVICPNCGNRFDCSDLNIFFD